MAPLAVGDGKHSVTFLFSVASMDRFYFYGTSSLRKTGSAVAYIASIANYGQVTDASTAKYVSGFSDEVPGISNSVYRYPTDKGQLPGIGKFVLGRNQTTGHYAILRVDAFNNPGLDGTLNVTWWFQTDGTGNFSASRPATVLRPAFFGLALAGLGVIVCARRVRKARR